MPLQRIQKKSPKEFPVAFRLSEESHSALVKIAKHFGVPKVRVIEVLLEDEMKRLESSGEIRANPSKKSPKKR